ncbi:class I SAM-dependent methyltransferase [Arsenicibacter rosenii]|uniref:Methyltransferase n=1 Tax=Arsenicibacter rosenii TaxID=1750698 RepID=A0A1S2VEN6_9BACT|nr:class I SAM-dependent methyltransferase [Arsenicibacter rosenii]OIN57172.1 methyltransferase [Arsenicibacter rosenii]
MSTETLTACPVCGSSQLSHFLTCKDYLVSQSDFTIQECTECSFRFTNPRPDQHSIGQFYKSEQYVSHNDESKGFINFLYRTVRQYTLKGKVNLINDLNKGTGSILDIGCGTGSFLEACSKRGWVIQGMEPDSDARKIASERLNSRIGESLQEFDPDKKYDVITLWHVLEHVAELDQVAYKLKQLLKPEGTLLIAVPNNVSADAIHYKQYWAAYDVPRHLHHFTPATIKRLMATHSLTLKDQQPMYFDSFYIAMLSTKYRDGRTNLVESFIQGLKSNLSARNSGNYSSVIYIFRHQ